jgi:hypothetical protein
VRSSESTAMFKSPSSRAKSNGAVAVFEETLRECVQYIHDAISIFMSAPFKRRQLVHGMDP